MGAPRLAAERHGAVGGCGLRFAADSARLAWGEFAWRFAVPFPLCALALAMVGPPTPPCYMLWCLGGCCISACSRLRASVSHGWGGHVRLAGCSVALGGWVLRRPGQYPKVVWNQRCVVPLAALCVGHPVCACLRSSLAPTGRMVLSWGLQPRMLLLGGRVTWGAGLHASAWALGGRRRLWALCSPVCSSRRRLGSPSWVLVRLLCV